MSTGLTDDDLAAVIAARPDGIMLPKCNAGADVSQLSAMLRVHEAENGLPDGADEDHPADHRDRAGVLSAATLPRSEPAPCRPDLGRRGPFGRDRRVAPRATQDGRYTDVFRLARAVTILGASIADVAAIDTVFVNFRDTEGLRRECLEAERDGFTAKMAIHPAQVPVINEAFTPSPEAVAHSQAIVQAFADAGNPGVVGIDGQMYDRPHLRRAERLLARAAAAAIA